MKIPYMDNKTSVCVCVFVLLFVMPEYIPTKC